MPVNTSKAIKERIAAHVADMRKLNDELTEKPADEDLKKRWAESLTQKTAFEEQLERAQLVEAHIDEEEQRGDNPGDLSPDERKDPGRNPDPAKYSFLRACERYLDNGKKVDGYEGECHDALLERFSKLGQDMNPQGFLVPLGLRMNQRASFTADGAKGGDLIQTDVPRTVIDVLRDKLVLQAAGMRVLSGLVGNIDLPKKTSATTFAWAAEDAAGAESNPVIDQIQLRPETVTGWTEISRRLMKQTQSDDAQALVLDDLMGSLAVGLDLAGINGSGASNQPEGLLQNSNVQTVAIGANGGALTWAKIVEMETEVAAGNGDINEAAMAYLVNARTRGLMKTTEKASGTAKFLWNDDNRVNGYRTGVTNALPGNLSKGSGTNLSGSLFGDFSQLILALWGAADVMVDPYTNSTKGNVRIILHQDANFANRHDESFAKCVDIDAGS